MNDGRVPEVCVLFAYHRNDELTRYHLEQARLHNPDAKVIPITCGVSDPLPDTVDVAAFPQPWQPVRDVGPSRAWRQCDTMLYRWFLNRNVSARRYVVLEYDCLCTQPLRESYGDAWDADVACAEFLTPEDTPQWRWFGQQEVEHLDPPSRSYAAGVVPFAGVLFSHGALERIIDNLTTDDVLSELRLGTAIRKAGIAVRTFTPSRCRSFRWYPLRKYPRGPGLFHPVKTLPQIDSAPGSTHLQPSLFWIASFPGSGGHLVCAHLNRLLATAQPDSIGATGTVANICSLPDFRLDNTPVVNDHWLAATHWRLSGANPYVGRTAASIYVLRHPLAVLEASIEHLALTGAARDSVIDSFVDTGTIPQWKAQGFGGWFEHVESWLGARNPHPALLVRYEDLHSQPRLEADRVTEFVGSVVSPAGWSEARRRVGPDEPSFTPRADSAAGKQLPTTNRSGLSLLTDEQLARFARSFETVLERLGYPVHP